MIARKAKNNFKGINNKKYEILIDNANKSDNPLDEIRQFNLDDNKYEIICSRSTNLNELEHEFIIKLTEENMSKLYEQSKWGWNISSKQKELTHKTAYILLVKDQLNDKYCAFAHFRFEYDDDKVKGVCYCYELQIAKDYQRKGIGSLLMQLIKEIGIKFKMSKILLTSFSNNENAMNFYIKKLGYHIDKSSPSRCVEGKTFYEILSLKI